MSTRGWEGVPVGTPTTIARTKYGNVKTTIDGYTFDSKREADAWIALKARAAAGEITDLRRQVAFPLLAPFEDRSVMVSHYVADFTYRDRAGALHVVDAKGMKTAMYKLKKKWLALQDGIRIEEC